MQLRDVGSKLNLTDGRSVSLGLFISHPFASKLKKYLNIIFDLNFPIQNTSPPNVVLAKVRQLMEDAGDDFCLCIPSLTHIQVTNTNF